MNPVVEFIKDFGNLISLGIVLSLAGAASWIFKASFSHKNSQIESLKQQNILLEQEIKLQNQQMNLLKEFSIENFVEKFRSQKEYYENHLKEWYEVSIKKLEDEKQKAIKFKEEELQKKLGQEIEKTKKLMEKYSSNSNPMMLKQLSHSAVNGDYLVVGHNPYDKDASYLGYLSIVERGEVFFADWTIGGSKQKHNGIGVLTGNTLAFHFRYDDNNGNTRHGVVLYEFLNEEVMRGHWAGYGSSNLGFEECRKIPDKNNTLFS